MPSVKLTSSLRRGFQILEAFTPSAPRMRLQDVVQKTKLPKVTALRFLRTLTELSYVSYDPKMRLYSLSPRVMSLGYTALSGVDLRKAAIPYMEELSSITGESVNLAILDGIEIVYIERDSMRRFPNIDMHVGTRLNVYQTALGKVILAYIAETESDRIVSQLLQYPEIAPHLGPNGKEIRNKLEEVRQQGYALNDEEHTKGLRAIAAPIFGSEGAVEAAVNIAVFAHLVAREELIERYLAPLLDTAKRISAVRGFDRYADMRKTLRIEPVKAS